MAGRSTCSNGSRPKRACRSRQAPGAPGIVTAPQPRAGTALCPAERNRSIVSEPGARPEALRPCSFCPSHTIAKASEPMPFEHGSTTVSMAAVATAASTALPPARSVSRPAWAARCWLVATTPCRTTTGMRRDGYGRSCRFSFIGEGALLWSIARLGGYTSREGPRSGGDPEDREERPRVAAHQRLDQIERVTLAQPPLRDQLGERLPEPLPRDRRVADHVLDSRVVAAEREQLVARRGQQELLDEAHAGGRVDDPGPAEVDCHVPIVLRQRDVLVLVWVADVHEYEGDAREVGQQRAEVAGVSAHPVERHPIDAGVVATVQLDRQPSIASRGHAPAHQMVLERLTLRRA